MSMSIKTIPLIRDDLIVVRQHKNPSPHQQSSRLEEKSRTKTTTTAHAPTTTSTTSSDPQNPSRAGQRIERGFSNRVYQRHKDSLVPCSKCGRSFFPHTVEYHQMNCKAGKLIDRGLSTKIFYTTIRVQDQSEPYSHKYQPYRPLPGRPITIPADRLSMLNNAFRNKSKNK